MYFPEISKPTNNPGATPHGVAPELRLKIEQFGFFQMERETGNKQSVRRLVDRDTRGLVRLLRERI